MAALAQTDTDRPPQAPLTAVVITATRAEARAHDVAAAISRIEASEVRDGHALVNISESLGGVPGLLARDRQNYAQDVQISVRGIGFSPDGRRAYVGAENSNEVYVVDAVAFTVITKAKAGTRGNGMTVHPDGKRVFVSNGGDASVSVLDVASNNIVATIGVGQRPWNMALTPDGRKLYVACGRSGTVAVIDTERNLRIADIAVGKAQWGVAIR